jgi:hypothetical protein
MVKFSILIPLIYSLIACTHIVYKDFQDGHTEVTVFSLGSDKFLEDFQASITPQSRSMSLGSLEENQTKGMSEFNKSLSLIVEGAVKGAVTGAK